MLFIPEAVFLLPSPNSQVYYQKASDPSLGKLYYFGYALSFIAAALLACGFAINQVCGDYHSIAYI